MQYYIIQYRYRRTESEPAGSCVSLFYLFCQKEVYMKLSSRFQVLLEKYSHIPYIRPSMLPKIDLYMDQVTTFMEERLQDMRRNPEDKILTKTMINNYTKNRLLPAPVKKKYTDEHLLLLNYIYYLKNILSIGDISVLLEPMTRRYWGKKDNGTSMRTIYRDILTLEHQMYRDSHEDVRKKIELAGNSFTDKNLPEEELEYLQTFALVSMLAFDVSLKKRMMEFLIDDMKASASRTDESGKSDNKKADSGKNDSRK